MGGRGSVSKSGRTRRVRNSRGNLVSREHKSVRVRTGKLENLNRHQVKAIRDALVDVVGAARKSDLKLLQQHGHPSKRNSGTPKQTRPYTFKSAESARRARNNLTPHSLLQQRMKSFHDAIRAEIKKAGGL